MNAKISLRIASLLSAAAIIVSGGVLSAPAAQAYPAGQRLALNVSQYNVTRPGSTIRVQVSHVYPRCSVSVAFQTRNGAKVTLTAGANGVTQQASIATPSKAGVYQLVAQTLRPCASPTGLESDSVKIYVGKVTRSDSRVSSSATVAGNKTVLTVTGSISEGPNGLSNVPVTIQIQKPNGSLTNEFSAKTNSSGQFTVRVTGEAALKGTYRALVSFDGDDDYIGSSDASNDLTLGK